KRDRRDALRHLRDGLQLDGDLRVRDRRARPESLNGRLRERPLRLSAYRFENCGALRALCRPAFLRSTWRASRVRKPSRLRGTRSSGFASTSARAIPCRTAPACPVRPPPWTRTRRSYCPSRPATLNGDTAIVCQTERGKYSSSARPLTHVFPSPGRRMTR